MEPNDKTSGNPGDLRWDVRLVVTFHALLLILLIVFLWSSVWALVSLLPWGQLPWATQEFMNVSGLVRSHPLLMPLITFCFLWADAKAYTWFWRKRGKKAATLWAIGVAAIIALAIGWFGYSFVSSLYWIADWHQQSLK